MRARSERSLRALWERYLVKIVIGVLVLLFFLAYFWHNIFYAIESGQAGVRWSRFFGGTVLNKVYREGTHAILPWDKMYIYSIRVQEIHGTLMVLSKNGLALDIEWSGRFYPNENQLPYLHRLFGPNYAEDVARPEYISSLRTVLGNYTDEEIYSRDEEGLLDEVDKQTKKNISAGDLLGRGLITFDQILLKSLKLPEAVQQAIQEKINQKHALLAYEFRLQSEEQEKKRTITQAEGIQQFQELTGISMLKWRGIEATEKLAQSPNSKIIIIGTGPDGLPIILNTDK